MNFARRKGKSVKVCIGLLNAVPSNLNTNLSNKLFVLSRYMN
jgi:hypothetical protein